MGSITEIRAIFIQDTAALAMGIDRGIFLLPSCPLEDMQEQIDTMLADSPVDSATVYTIKAHVTYGVKGVRTFKDLEEVKDLVATL